jgi:hypothetical protein
MRWRDSRPIHQSTASAHSVRCNRRHARASTARPWRMSGHVSRCVHGAMSSVCDGCDAPQDRPVVPSRRARRFRSRDGRTREPPPPHPSPNDPQTRRVLGRPAPSGEGWGGGGSRVRPARLLGRRACREDTTSRSWDTRDPSPALAMATYTSRICADVHASGLERLRRRACVEARHTRVCDRAASV